MTFRWRLLAALILAASVAGIGFALENVVAPRIPSPPLAADGASGAWYCPHGGGSDWNVSVALANPTAGEARVLLTTFQRDGRPEEQRLSVPPMSTRSVQVPAPHIASGSLVESFEASVAAATVVTRPEGRGLAAEPCAARAGARWVVPDGSSLRGEDAWLVAVNPFSLDAVFDVTIAMEERAIQPGPLRGVVLPARRAVAFNLNRFALGEATVSAHVDVSLGRVSVAGLVMGEGREGGLRSSLAVSRPARTWLLPAGGEDPADLAVGAGTRDVPFRVRIQGAAVQSTSLEDSSVDAGRAATFEVAEAAEAGIVVESQGEAELFAGRRFRRGDSSDPASTAAVRRGGRRWVVIPPWAPGVQSALVLQNPGDQAVTVRLTLLSGGEVVLPPARVDAGRTLAVQLDPADAPEALLIETEDGEVVASATSIGEAGYAVALGSRLDQLWPS